MKPRKVEIPKVGKLITNFVKEHAAEMLTGAGVVGVIFTAVAAYKAYPKVQKALDDLPEDATTLQTVIAVAPEVASPVVVGTMSIVCIVSSNIVSTRRLVAVTACYKAIDEAYKSYKDKDREVAGESHVEYVEGLAEADRNKNLSSLAHVGSIVCEEKATGRVFYSSIENIQRACTLSVTDRWPPFPIDMPVEIPLNDIYDWLCIKKTQFGKQTFRLFDPHIELEYEGGVLENGEPYVSFWFPQLSQN